MEFKTHEHLVESLVNLQRLGLHINLRHLSVPRFKDVFRSRIDRPLEHLAVDGCGLTLHHLVNLPVEEVEIEAYFPFKPTHKVI